jgi:hypothetical protein
MPSRPRTAAWAEDSTDSLPIAYSITRGSVQKCVHGAQA